VAAVILIVVALVVVISLGWKNHLRRVNGWYYNSYRKVSNELLG
jgi:hypothetical protein